MKQYIPIILLLLAFASCGTKKNMTNDNASSQDSTKRWTYNRILKTNDYEIKYEKAKEYYDNEKYLKANDIYEQLVPHYRGMARGEEVYFYYCMSNMKMGDYLFAGYHFKNLYDLYPNSQYAEQSLFLSAYCNYLETPRWSLDQQPTTDAMSQFQLFLSKFPNSNLVDSSNFLMDTLRYTLEEKSYMNAKLYYNLGYYKAADIALNNSIHDYPGSSFNEDALFYMIKANYKYAVGSIRKKQSERYRNTISNCLRYKNKYPSGKYISEVEKILKNSQKKINTSVASK